MKTPLLIDFVKITAQGNNYIYLDRTEKGLPETDLSELAQKLSDVNTGIGSDGMVIILKDERDDVFMRMWNKDGSESDICGSALRSVIALLARKSGYARKIFTIRTAVGKVQGELLNKEDLQVRIDLSDVMQRAKINPFAKKEPLTIRNWIGITVYVGNHHFVIFECLQKKGTGSFSRHDFIQQASLIEKDGHFHDKPNVEFVEIRETDKAVVTVWEIGSGFTQACGTGALAVVLAGMNSGLLRSGTDVIFPGGKVRIDVDRKKEQYCLTGSVDFVCWGETEYSGRRGNDDR
jgi:diaminopimelate epimerase